MKDEKFHYYNFSFVEQGSGGPTYSSTVIGYRTKFVDSPRMKEAKRYVGMSGGAVLLGVSYLGHLTYNQMGGSIHET